MALDPEQSNTAEALPPGTRIAALVSSYHREVCDEMLSSARRELSAAGLAEEDFLVHRAPGAFELPLLASALAARSDVDAVLCFGLVLKGETRHDEHIAAATAHGIARVGLDSGKPVLFGVLTCNSLEQAVARSRSTAAGGEIDKGREVARATIATLASLRSIRSGTLRDREEHS